MTTPMPVRRILCAAAEPDLPDAATVLRHPLAAGLPGYLPIVDEVGAFVIVATGVVRPWLAAPATAVVTCAGWQRDPHGTHPDAAPVGRLLLRLGRRTAAVVPLVLGARRTLVREPAPPVTVAVRDWDIRVAALHGPGCPHSYVELAWWPSPPAARWPVGTTDPAGTPLGAAADRWLADAVASWPEPAS